MVAHGRPHKFWDLPKRTRPLFSELTRLPPLVPRRPPTRQDTMRTYLLALAGLGAASAFAPNGLVPPCVPRAAGRQAAPLACERLQCREVSATCSRACSLTKAGARERAGVSAHAAAARRGSHGRCRLLAGRRPRSSRRCADMPAPVLWFNRLRGELTPRPLPHAGCVCSGLPPDCRQGPPGSARRRHQPQGYRVGGPQARDYQVRGDHGGGHGEPYARHVSALPRGEMSRVPCCQRS